MKYIIVVFFKTLYNNLKIFSTANMSKRKNKSGGSKDKRTKQDKEESRFFQDKDHHTSTLSAMQQSREEGEFIDVTVVSGNARFDAHRLVLKSAIPYFQAMFSQDFIEKKSASLN